MTFQSKNIALTTVCDEVAMVRERIAKLPRKTRRVLDLLLAGHPNKIIAWQLDMPITTVKSHLSQIFQTLGCANRTHASLIAFCVAHELEIPLMSLTKQRGDESDEYFSKIHAKRSMNIDFADLT
jgi:DNA-binding CsgD family transcriptional regulator